MGWYLIGPDGTELDLNAGPYYAVRGVSGFLWLPVEYEAQRSPFGGEVVVDTRIRGRRIDLPIFVRCGTDLAGCIQRLVEHVSIDPEQPSFLVWRGARERRLAVVLRSAARWSDAQRGRDYVRLILPLFAPSPYWENVSETSLELNQVDGAPFLPDWPFLLTASNVYAAHTVEIAGAKAYPIWIVEGPANDIRITNRDTGQTWNLVGVNLLSNEQVVINTRPEVLLGRSAIRILRYSGSEENGWPYLEAASVLWHLKHGKSSIQVEITGSSVGTRVKLRFRELYATPWTVNDD